MWLGLMVAPAVSLFSIKGTLAQIYAVRAIVCMATLLILMLRADWHGRAKG